MPTKFSDLPLRTGGTVASSTELMALSGPEGDPSTKLVRITRDQLRAYVRSVLDASQNPIPAGRFQTSGNQIIDSDGHPVLFRSVNWYGMEGVNHIPGGLWARRWTEMIDQIKTLGFNCIRFPFGGSFRNPNLTANPGGFHGALNSDFTGKNAWQVFDMIVDYCATKNIYVVPDFHNASDTGGVDGGPEQPGQTKAQWISTWVMFATRYKDKLNVLGADLYNEPKNYQWGAWASMAEECANAIHAVAPDWLIFVEGVSNNTSTWYWDGGDLRGVRTRPVVLTAKNKVVYSPHDYGQTIGSQPWLQRTPTLMVPNYPNNLYDVFREFWGYIFQEGIAPIWVGEFGAALGFDDAGTGTVPLGPDETKWFDTLIKYISGDFNGSGANLPAGQKMMSWAYFSFNSSSQPIGLLKADWTTLHQIKMDHLQPLLDASR